MINSDFVVNYHYFQEIVELLLPRRNEVYVFYRKYIFDALRNIIISIIDQS